MYDFHSVPLTKLVDEFSLEVVYAADDYAKIALTVEDVGRPGLLLAGYYDYFEPMRLQVVGNVEMSYLQKLSPAERESVFDHLFSYKIPALLTFFPEIALHITRGVRWDSDHVVRLDDETKELCREIVRCGGLTGRVKIALDYFDASINRIAAWTVGFRNVQKALLLALLEPDMTDLQDRGDMTSLLVRQEEVKTLPFGEIWEEYCARCSVPADGQWLSQVKAYEQNVLSRRK